MRPPSAGQRDNAWPSAPALERLPIARELLIYAGVRGGLVLTTELAAAGAERETVIAFAEASKRRAHRRFKGDRFELCALPGTLTTLTGSVVYVVFALCDRRSGGVVEAYEHLFDPWSEAHLRPYRALAAQRRWHVTATTIDARPTRWLEIDNRFLDPARLGRLVARARKVPQRDYLATVADVQLRFPNAIAMIAAHDPRA